MREMRVNGNWYAAMAVFEGDDIELSDGFHCFCHETITQLLAIIKNNLGDTKFDDVDVILIPLRIEVRLKVERKRTRCVSFIRWVMGY